MSFDTLFDNLPELFKIQHLSDDAEHKQVTYQDGVLLIKREISNKLTDNEHLILWLILKTYNETDICDWTENYKNCLNEWVLYGKHPKMFFDVFLNLLDKYAKNNRVGTRHTKYLNNIKQNYYINGNK